GVQAPGVPVDQPHVAEALIAWKQRVPHVSVPVNDRDVPMRAVPVEQARRGGEEPLVHLLALRGEAIAEAIGEGGEIFRQGCKLTVERAGLIRKGADGDAEARIIPPRRVESCVTRDDRME